MAAVPPRPPSSPAPRAWDGPHPEFAYSESQDRRRRTCARAHLHGVHTAHRGWSAPPGSAPWLAYRLKKAQPLAAALGSAVHTAATRCVRALVAGRGRPPFAALRDDAAAELNARWRNSRRRRQAFWRRPQDAPVFLEALYREGPTAEALARARAKLDRVLRRLLACDAVWAWVRAAAPGDVIVVDPFYRFVLPDPVLSRGLPVYAAPDLLVRAGPLGAWHVVDFKSGRPDGVVDQVLTYALAAVRGLGLDFAEANAVGAVVALDGDPADRVATFAITPEDVAGAEARIRANVAAARALLVDPVTNAPLAVHAVPGPPDPRACRWCAFRALCYSGEYPLAVLPQTRGMAWTRP